MGKGEEGSVSCAVTVKESHLARELWFRHPAVVHERQVQCQVSFHARTGFKVLGGSTSSPVEGVAFVAQLQLLTD